MPKRKLEDEAEWTRHKAAILKLYIEENRSLTDVIHAMANRSFSKSKPQYERIFKQWGVSKNVREEEWKFIFARLEERHGLQKNSVVHVRGLLIPAAKLERQKKKLRQTTFDQCLAQIGRASRAKSPLEVEVCTPPLSPSAEDADNDRSSLRAGQEDARSVHWQTQFPGTDPESLFLNQPAGLSVPNMSIVAFSAAAQHASRTSLPEEQLVLHNDDRAYGSARTEPVVNQSFLMMWFSEAYDQWVPRISQQQVSATSTSSEIAQAPVPRHLTHSAPRRVTLEMIHTEKLAISMMRKARFEADLRILRSLFALWGAMFMFKHVIPRRLLLLATVDGNLPLVKVLLEAGVDPNTRIHLGAEANEHTRAADISCIATHESHLEMQSLSMTALHAAVFTGREDLVMILLENGATEWTAEFRGAEGYIFGSILDVAMDVGMPSDSATGDTGNNKSISSSIMRAILHFGSPPCQQSRDIMLRTLRHMVLRSRLDLILLMLEYHPELFESAKTTPWILLEAASTLGKFDIFKFLVQKGFDLHATNASGLGSALAAAAAHQYAPKLISQLHKAGMDINGMAFGLGASEYSSQKITPGEKKLEGINGLTALHIAVRDNNEELVRILLLLGADVSHCHQVYPLQLAAWNGHESLAKVLIEAGADINAVHEGQLCIASEAHQSQSPALFAHKTAARIASERGHWRLVAVLRSFGAKLVTTGVVYEHWDGMVLLGEAIVDNKDMFLHQLLLDVALPGGKLHPQHGCRALHLAMQKDRIQLVPSLFSAGASPYVSLDPCFGGLECFDECQDLTPWESPFERSIRDGDMLVSRTFLECSGYSLDEDHRLVIKKQLCAAFAAARCTSNHEIETLLVGHGLDLSEIDTIMGPNYVKQQLHYQLQHAAGSGDFDEVIRLLDANAPSNSPNAEEASGTLTPLHFAVEADSLEIAEVLISSGAIVNTAPYIVGGKTVLQLAASKGNLAMVVLLVNTGAYINARPAAYKGRTALEAAAEHGHTSVARYLLTQGADIGDRYHIHTRRSLYRAWKNGHGAVINVLKTRMTDYRGQGDPRLVHDIAETVTEEELVFIDQDAKLEYEAYLLHHEAESEEEEEQEGS